MSWPRCPACDGPSRPEGPPHFSVLVEVTTVSEANRRDTWGKINRKAEQRDRVVEEVAVSIARGGEVPKRGPWFLRLTRIAPHALDPAVNLPSALKAVEDAFAAVLGVDDGSAMLETKCAQRKARKGESPGVLIEVWGS